MKKVFVLLSLMLVLAVAFSAVSPAAAQPTLKDKGGSVQESFNGVYVVQMSDMPVVASSVSGGGKTTLVKSEANLLQATTLFFDDYASVSQYPPDIKKWVEDGADVNEWKTPQFAQDLAPLRRGESIVWPLDGASILPSEFIVIEEPMGRERAEMASLIDFVAVIDIPLEIALARRLLRNLGFIPLEGIENATKEQMVEGFVQVVTSLKNSLNEYLRAGRDVNIAVQKQAKENCDFVLDGFLSVDELAQQLVSAVKNKPRWPR